MANAAAESDALVAWLTAWVARELEMPEAEFDPARSLMDYGLSSVAATMLVGDLEEHCGLELSPTLAWDYPTVNEIAAHAAEQMGAAPDAGPDADAVEGMSDAEVDALLASLSAEGRG